MENPKAESVLEPLHPDFQHILRMFKQRYGEEEGERIFWAWVRKMGLDPDKPYTWPQEAFRWAEPLISLYHEDENAKYYRVEALFPVTSLNRNVYLESELVLAARSLVGRPVNINHEHPLEGVEIIGAEYEDGAVECLLRVRKDAEWNGKRIIDLIDSEEIMHVSIEAVCQRGLEPDAEGNVCKGLVFTGLALLTRDALPGVPLTRILPVEKIVEAYEMETPKQTEEKPVAEEQLRRQTCTLCNRPVSDYVRLADYVVHPKCAQRFWQIAMDIFHFQEKAVPPHETPKAPEDRPWDADAAERRIREWAGGPDKDSVNWSKYRQAFAWYDAEDPENFGSYKLPHHDVIDGRLVVVWRGTAAAMAALLGARGGVDIPAADRRAVYRHLARHYRQFDKEPPEFREKTELLETENRILAEQLEQVQAKLREALEEKKTLEARLKRAKRYSRIIVRI
jgi:hypothetical protein